MYYCVYRSIKDFVTLNSPPDSEVASQDEIKRNPDRVFPPIPAESLSAHGGITPVLNRHSIASNRLSIVPNKKRKIDSQTELIQNLGKSVLNLGNALTHYNHRPGDASENVGIMVASQHRSLQPHQQVTFVKDIAKAYLNALSYNGESSSDS